VGGSEGGIPLVYPFYPQFSIQECASFFLDSSREKIKHAMCALLVEILLPVAAVIKFEASLPVVRKFVSMLYTHCFDYAKRGARHSTVRSLA
jgi:hypothetical protein